MGYIIKARTPAGFMYFGGLGAWFWHQIDAKVFFDKAKADQVVEEYRPKFDAAVQIEEVSDIRHTFNGRQGNSGKQPG